MSDNLVLLQDRGIPTARCRHSQQLPSDKDKYLILWESQSFLGRIEQEEGHRDDIGYQIDT